jgi:hypothetical protein
MASILDRNHYIHMYRTSHLFLLSFLYGMVRHHYNLAIVPGLIFLGSINYWKNPDYSYRRYLDIGITTSGVIYQNYIAYNAEYANIYYFIFLTGILSYPVGIYYYRKKEYWKYTCAHCVLHIMGNIGTIVLYSGYIFRDQSSQ